MSQRFGTEQFVSKDIFETVPHLFELSMRDLLTYEAKKQGYKITSEYHFMESCYYKQNGDRWIPVSSKEEADIIGLHIIAEAELIEPIVKVDVVSHMDGCSYPDTRQWCDDHIKEAWQGMM